MKKLLTSTLVVLNATLLMTSANVLAQEAADTEADDDLLEEVTVTGSRIKRDGYTSPTPVTVASNSELTAITPTHIADGLNKMPQFQMSSSPSRGLHNWPREDSHGNLLNLRSLEPVRTLVLLDGMRLPPTNIPGTFDVSVLPTLLMDRVEIVTGGASAAYGADAVAGVANFILDKDYTGIKGTLMGGVSEEGDNENYRVSVAGGFDFAGERGHVLLSAEKYQNDGMLKSDREVNNEGWMYLAGPQGYDLVRDGRLNLATSGGLIRGPAGFEYSGYQFLPDGSIAPMDYGTPGGVFTSGGDGFSIPFDTSAVAEQDNGNLFARASYEFSDNLSGYAQGLYSKAELDYTSLSNSLNGIPFNVYSGNPFLPPEMQAAMDAAGLDAIQVAEYGGDTIKPLTEEVTDYYMLEGGLDGVVFDDWYWSAKVSYGESKKKMDQHGQYEWAKVYAALDVVTDSNGNPACYAAVMDPRPEVRAMYADCVPLHILGGDPATQTPAGYDYTSGTSRYEATYKQWTLQAIMSGSVFDMPAGPLDVAFGAEYRDSKLRLTSNADPALLDNFDENGNPVDEQTPVYGPIDNPYQRGMPAAQRNQWYWLTNTGVADTDDSVLELFVEGNIPLIANKPGFRQFDLIAAYRYTDYDISGSVDTWKLGLQWRPVDSVLLRGTVSRDIRAPSLYSLGRGDTFRIGFLDDPVSGESGNITQVDGASDNLVPEESDSYTFGVVWTPESVPGLALSLDYYSMDIEGAISAGLNAVEVVNRCYESGGTAPECDQISRPAPGEFPTSVRIVEGNFAFLKTAGFDFEGNYYTELGEGELALHMLVNYLDEYETQANAEAPVLDWRGIASIGTSVSQGRPEWMGMLNVRYDLGNFGVVLSEQYIGEQTIDRVGIETVFAPGVDTKVDPVWYTDLTLTYDFWLQGGLLQAFFTVNNLFDKDPPLIPSTLPSSSPVTIIGVYDQVGRAYNAGVRFEF